MSLLSPKLLVSPAYPAWAGTNWPAILRNPSPPHSERSTCATAGARWAAALMSNIPAPWLGHIGGSLPARRHKRRRAGLNHLLVIGHLFENLPHLRDRTVRATLPPNATFYADGIIALVPTQQGPAGENAGIHARGARRGVRADLHSASRPSCGRRIESEQEGSSSGSLNSPRRLSLRLCRRRTVTRESREVLQEHRQAAWTLRRKPTVLGTSAGVRAGLPWITICRCCGPG